MMMEMECNVATQNVKTQKVFVLAIYRSGPKLDYAICYLLCMCADYLCFGGCVWACRGGVLKRLRSMICATDCSGEALGARGDG